MAKTVMAALTGRHLMARICMYWRPRWRVKKRAGPRMARLVVNKREKGVRYRFVCKYLACQYLLRSNN